MEWKYPYKKPRKLTDEEIAMLKADLAAAKPYVEGELTLDDPNHDVRRGLATLAKKFLDDDRKLYPEYYEDE